MPWTTHIDDFDPAQDDVGRIGHGEGVPCRVCATIFQRLRLTWRYCAQCRRAFCEGEHGNFAGGRGLCVRCYSDTTGQLL